MSLAASGNLSILTTSGSNRNISLEVDRDSTAPKSLSTLNNHAYSSPLYPVSMSDFYSHTQPYVNFGSITYPVSTPKDIDSNRPLNSVNKNAQNWEVNIHGYIYSEDSSCSSKLYYNSNGNGWVEFLSQTGIGTTDYNGILPFYYSDTLTFRIYVHVTGIGYSVGIIEITSVTENGSTRKPYYASPYYWAEYVN
jgi:hypothetical protein